MSISQNSSQSIRTRAGHIPSLNLDTQQATSRDLSSTDDLLKNLSQHILPPDPFLISVPTDVPFRQSSALAHIWKKGTPFDFDEEQLQYLSFHSHLEEDTLLQAFGGWSDNKGNILKEDPNQDPPGSAKSTPVLEPQKKKKITLGQYKQKEQVKERSEQPPSSQEPTSKMNAVDRRPPPKETAHAVKSLERPRKRSIHDTVEVDTQGRKSIAQDSQRSPRPEKKPRVSDISTNGKKDNSDSQKPSRHLPALLSPNLPPTSKDAPLPRLLSPTLPPGLDELFAKKPSTPSNIANPKKDPEPSNTSKNSTPSSTEKSKEKQAFKLDVKRDRSDSQSTNKSSTPVSRTNHDRINNPSPKPSPSFVAAKDVRRLQQQSQLESPPPRRKKIVVLKYGRRNGVTVQRLLKLASKLKARPEKEQTERDSTTEPTSRTEKSEKKVQTPQGEVRKGKRPPEHEEVNSGEPPTKRPKVPPNLNLSSKPSTPVPQSFKSPVTQSSGFKAQFNTPKKTLKTAAMHRLNLSDPPTDVATPETAATTPQGTAQQATPRPKDRTNPTADASPPSMSRSASNKDHSATPQAHNEASNKFSQTHKVPGLSTPTPANPGDERPNWRSLRDKFFNVGRTIKHEASSLAAAHRADPSSADHKLACVLFLEGLLAFMLNLAVNEKSNAANWRSIIDYWEFVGGAVRSYKHLESLCGLLGGVCLEQIARADWKRWESITNSAAIQQNMQAPTPGSDGNGNQAAATTTDVNSVSAATEAAKASLSDTMGTNHQRIEKVYRDATALLDPRDVQRQYPRTWTTGPAKMYEVRGTGDGIRPDRLVTGYYVPVRDGSSPFEAVAYGMEFLGEWCEKEGVEWEGRLNVE
ncbi:MAG: hypothetical protein Q9227_004695 [Pyrenula ochraceoflavens]